MIEFKFDAEVQDVNEGRKDVEIALLDTNVEPPIGYLNIDLDRFGGVPVGQKLEIIIRVKE